MSDTERRDASAIEQVVYSALRMYGIAPDDAHEISKATRRALAVPEQAPETPVWVSAEALAFLRADETSVNAHVGTRVYRNGREGLVPLYAAPAALPRQPEQAPETAALAPEWAWRSRMDGSRIPTTVEDALRDYQGAALTEASLGDEARQALRALQDAAPAALPDGKDAERFRFWFSPAAKSVDMNGYLQGIREGWTTEQWREFTDAAIQAQTEGERAPSPASSSAVAQGGDAAANQGGER